MFVGHGLVAFAVAAGLARWAGWSPERALALGVVAGAFGLVPDVDILYAPVGLVGANTVLAAEEGFWSAGNLVHRTVTHSLLVGAVAALGAWAWRRGTRPAEAVALAVGAGLVAVAALDGALPAVVMAAFVGATAVVATAGGRVGLAPRDVGAAALVGLLLHPFGDLFTGEPPALLYPLDLPLVTERVVLHPDPTLHLVGAFGVELATAWLAAVVYLRLTGRRFPDHLAPRAALGVVLAGAVVLLPPPSLETPYRFVFSALGVGLVSAVGVDPRGWRAAVPSETRSRGVRSAMLTGLTALSTGLVAYAVLYVWL